MTKFIAALLCAAMLAGCAENNQEIGLATGAVLGGYAGSQFGKGNGQLVATGVGTLAGAMIGAQIGAQEDRAVQQQHHQYYPVAQPRRVLNHTRRTCHVESRVRFINGRSYVEEYNVCG